MGTDEGSLRASARFVKGGTCVAAAHSLKTWASGRGERYGAAVCSKVFTISMCCFIRSTNPL